MAAFARIAKIIIGLVAGGAASIASALAQPPAGYEAFWDGPTEVNLAGRPVVADIALYADRAAAGRGDLRIALVVDVAEFIDQTETDLENWVARRQDRCGERWKAGAPLIAFPTGLIRFALALELEVWNCGWDGKGKPGRLAHEGARVDVTLEPYIEDGRLQARLSALTVDQRIGVSKYLPLEFALKQALSGELKKLNDNPKFYRAPNPLYAEGLRYESIAAKADPQGPVVITARYRGRGEAAALERIAEKMAADGVTQ